MKEVWKEALQLPEANGTWIGIFVAICLDKWFKEKIIKDHGVLP
jgi:hypothetical protein